MLAILILAIAAFARPLPLLNSFGGLQRLRVQLVLHDDSSIHHASLFVDNPPPFVAKSTSPADVKLPPRLQSHLSETLSRTDKGIPASFISHFPNDGSLPPTDAPPRVDTLARIADEPDRVHPKSGVTDLSVCITLAGQAPSSPGADAEPAGVVRLCMAADAGPARRMYHHAVGWVERRLPDVWV